MANTVRADVTDLLAELGLTAPQDAEFVPAVPTDNLLELWRGDVHVTLDGSGNVRGRGRTAGPGQAARLHD
jgi:hypothetical protein